MISFQECNHEVFYHALVTGISICALDFGFRAQSNKESGKGRYDLLVYPSTEANASSPAFLFEFKLSSSKKQLKKEAKNAFAANRRKEVP